MAGTWLYALVSVVLVSGVSLIGLVGLAVRPERLRGTLFVLVSVAAGSMFGDTFIHLLPAAYAVPEMGASTPLSILAGIFGFFSLEKFLRWRHEHAVDSRVDVEPIGYLNLIADGVHNLIDGMLVGAAYLASVPIGVATTVAIVLHEIPQELGDFGVLLQAGFSTAKALAFNLLSATLAIAGALIILVASGSGMRFVALTLPLTAGSFIYIAGADLLPELHKERTPVKSIIQLIAMAGGAGVMLLIDALE